MPETTNKIKALVSTKLTQGYRKNDFCYVPENELVRRAFVCEKHMEDPDEETCGCNRAFEGIRGYSTTTAKVAFVDMTREQYIDEYVKTNPFAAFYEKDEDYRKEIEEDAKWFLKAADSFEIGTVFEFRAGKFDVRDVEKGKL